jgi:cytoskeletal protein CcmA (bactofilin family)
MSRHHRLSRARPSNGVSITGSLKFEGEFEIDCELEGTVDSTGRLNVGKTRDPRRSRVGSVTVHGTVDGNITATGTLRAAGWLHFAGDIEAPRLGRSTTHFWQRQDHE